MYTEPLHSSLYDKLEEMFGFEKGKIEAKKEFTKKLLAEKFSIEKIAELTDLDIEQVRTIYENISKQADI